MWTQWKFILCSYRWPVLDSEIFKWNNHNLGQKYKNFCYTGSTLECMYITFICVCIYIYIYISTYRNRANSKQRDSLLQSWSRPHELLPTRLLCPWDSPGKNTAVGCYALLQGIFLTQGLNLWFLWLSCIAGGFFTTEPLGKSANSMVEVKSVLLLRIRGHVQR